MYRMDRVKSRYYKMFYIFNMLIRYLFYEEGFAVAAFFFSA